MKHFYLKFYFQDPFLLVLVLFYSQSLFSETGVHGLYPQAPTNSPQTGNRNLNQEGRQNPLITWEEAKTRLGRAIEALDDKQESERVAKAFFDEGKLQGFDEIKKRLEAFSGLPSAEERVSEATNMVKRFSEIYKAILNKIGFSDIVDISASLGRAGSTNQFWKMMRGGKEFTFRFSHNGSYDFSLALPLRVSPAAVLRSADGRIARLPNGKSAAELPPFSVAASTYWVDAIKNFPNTTAHPETSYRYSRQTYWQALEERASGSPAQAAAYFLLNQFPELDRSTLGLPAQQR